MTERRARPISADYGGTGVRGYEYGSDGRPSRLFSIPLEDLNDRETPLQERVHRALKLSGRAIGAVVHAVDGSDIGDGIFYSFKAGQPIDPRKTAEEFGYPSEGMNDVEAIAWGLGGLTASRVDQLVDSGRSVAPNFRNRSTIAATVSSGYGTAAVRMVGEGEIISSLHGGHVGFQVLDSEEDTVVRGIREMRDSGSAEYSDIVTVEEVIAGAQITRVAEILTPSYAEKLRANYDNETDMGITIARDAEAGVKEAIRIMKLRARVLATAVRDAAAQHEAEAFALTGGALPGLLPWMKGSETEFAKRVQAVRPSHAYTAPDVFRIPDGLGAEGALRRAAQLMENVGSA